MLDINFVKNLNCRCVIVTKNQTIEDIDYYYKNNHLDFGENKIQEILKKKDQFPNVRWHFIGRIQSNKIKQIVANSYMIHSVSDKRYLELINSEAMKINKVQKILIQLNLACEKTKSGITADEIDDFISLVNTLDNVELLGIMLIGDHTDDENIINKTFKTAKEIKDKYNFYELSMGMSNDYKLAIDNGSTMVRIGSLLF